MTPQEYQSHNNYGVEDPSENKVRNPIPGRLILGVVEKGKREHDKNIKEHKDVKPLLLKSITERTHAYLLVRERFRRLSQFKIPHFM